MVAFDQFYIMTAGGPRTDTFTSVYWMYQNSFIYFNWVTAPPWRSS